MSGNFEKSFRLTFAGALYNRLSPPRSIGLQPLVPDWKKTLANPTWNVVQLRGQLALREHGEDGRTKAEVRLLVTPDWTARLPFAFNNEKFLRREIDWHSSKDGLLCYAQDGEWRWKLGQLWNTADSDQFIDLTSNWCIRNLDSLLTRHLHGHRYGLTKWPREWDQWSHHEKGIRELERLIQKEDHYDHDHVPV
jgi:hypothetical protein